MTQAFLFQPTGKQVKAPPRDPYNAETSQEFQELFESKYHRPAVNAEIMDWYESHPEAYEARFHEPHAAFKKRCNAVRARAEASSKSKRVV